MSTTTGRRSSTTRRVAAVAAIGAVGAAAALAAVALHTSSPAVGTPGAAGASALGQVQLAGWSGTPKALSASTSAGAAAAAWCEAGLSADSSAQASVADVDQRGSIVSMVVSRGGYSSYCLSDGADHGMWEVVGEPGTEPAAVAANAIDLGSEDQHGTPAVSSAWGSAGADVRSVVLRVGGRTVEATVGHGMWTAWWPGSTAQGALQAVVTTDDASSTTVTLGR